MLMERSLRIKWGQTTFRKHSENVVCPLFILFIFMSLFTLLIS